MAFITENPKFRVGYRQEHFQYFSNDMGIEMAALETATISIFFGNIVLFQIYKMNANIKIRDKFKRLYSELVMKSV